MLRSPSGTRHYLKCNPTGIEREVKPMPFHVHSLHPLKITFSHFLGQPGV